MCASLLLTLLSRSLPHTLRIGEPNHHLHAAHRRVSLVSHRVHRAFDRFELHHAVSPRQMAVFVSKQIALLHRRVQIERCAQLRITTPVYHHIGFVCGHSEPSNEHGHARSLRKLELKTLRIEAILVARRSTVDALVATACVERVALRGNKYRCVHDRKSSRFSCRSGNRSCRPRIPKCRFGCTAPRGFPYPDPSWMLELMGSS